jgi:hypothetical protein
MTFEKHLKAEEELPRLSILENYKKISRIMTNSFLRSKENNGRYNLGLGMSEEQLKKKQEEDTR